MAPLLRGVGGMSGKKGEDEWLAQMHATVAFPGH